MYQGVASRSPPASDQYLFASGERCVAGGDGTEVTRRVASDGHNPLIRLLPFLLQTTVLYS